MSLIFTALTREQLNQLVHGHDIYVHQSEAAQDDRMIHVSPPPVCRRCVGMDYMIVGSDICGSCADDLREEEKAVRDAV